MHLLTRSTGRARLLIVRLTDAVFRWSYCVHCGRGRRRPNGRRMGLRLPRHVFDAVEADQLVRIGLRRPREVPAADDDGPRRPPVVLLWSGRRRSILDFVGRRSRQTLEVVLQRYAAASGEAVVRICLRFHFRAINDDVCPISLNAKQLQRNYTLNTSIPHTVPLTMANFWRSSDIFSACAVDERMNDY